MRHYFNFAMWCLRKFGRWLITYPNHLFEFYKEALREETVMTLVFSMLGWMAAMSVTGFIVSTRVEGTTKVSSEYGAAAFLFTVFFPPAFFAFTLLGMLYDRYCAELQGTMDRLKRQ